jgi:hypothetical protein
MSIEKNVLANAIQFLDDGVYIVEKRGVKKRFADPIQITAFGTSEPGTAREEAYTAVRFLDRDGKRKKVIVRSSMLVSQPSEFVTLLAGRGYLWPQARRRKIIDELSIVRPKFILQWDKYALRPGLWSLAQLFVPSKCPYMRSFKVAAMLVPGTARRTSVAAYLLRASVARELVRRHCSLNKNASPRCDREAVAEGSRRGEQLINCLF